MNHKSRILIVDDNPIARENLGDLLETQGHELAFANDGGDALSATATFNPDLVLLDVMMPDMDGFEVCRRLRANPSTAEVPVILVTALDDRASRLNGIRAGADDFITKPFDSVELRARVQGITRLNRFRRLMAERTKFERVVAHSETGYLLVNSQGKILFTNPMAALYLQLPENGSHPVQASFQDLVRKEYRREPKDAWTDWPESHPEGMTRYLVRPETETAQAMWLQVDTLDNLTTDEDSSWIISLKDVTAEMASQRDRRKFHTMITHKLRTPFISILTGLELLIKHTDQLSRSEIAELSSDAYKWARRLYDDIEEVVRYVDSPALAEPGCGLNIVQLPLMVANVCSSLGVHHATTTGTEDLVGVRVSLSRQAMETILWEVLGNAKKFHPSQQPNIEVTVAYENAGELTLHISDDGMTLSPEQLSHIWTPYYQGEKFFTGQVEGMGLGLPLVASMVWNVGGRCRIFNRVGAPGVTVDLTLPCTYATRKEDDEAD